MIINSNIQDICDKCCLYFYSFFLCLKLFSHVLAYREQKKILNGIYKKNINLKNSPDFLQNMVRVARYAVSECFNSCFVESCEAEYKH